ncbi:hypothetical protein A3C91_01030 [Candidatus Azambacteria bacterium RIFCSPHIGHO2_02_FULL_52_12]|uniref:Histidine kinase N-terminal 7TM region domain-containing protein n=1 Tax=Candidatus Azambacteria bacterium RIFCSPLOWO2_01_FULL_46_25 TaxID=1797298 RepID=A0A1F5BU12_9BACT|nr:MAG: hypothetical protein A3C91_01030 [Candidatus Azambacteria bacterium RIFCSPHIGHO2_02_FULL_52_12]OGD34103.1 MAG: hypothetical protein A2988_01310 [Candidatus Azambacteria bacterium RIFCSPLOWO2_01_FULL_46_25]OGD36702.1 MAG: hypothetical protein A2850_00265 [Candidatus Azambacteria bacterium RIFCSPHIGHO2_01_FULL_51_74]
MFSIFVYLFSAIISLWASAFFYKAWKKTGGQNYHEFYLFFVFLVMSFTLYAFSSGIAAEIGNFIMLFSFAFVLRAFIRFQQVKSVSPNFISAVVAVFSFIKLFVGMNALPQPVIQGFLIYWHYAIIDAIVFSIGIILFTLALGVTFLSNLANIKKNKVPLFFLGLGFLFAGLGGSLVVLVNDFWPLLVSYIFIFTVFVCASVFILSSHTNKA